MAESKQLHDLEQDIRTLDMFQRAVKIIINQVYGAFGNPYFYFSNRDIAESITLQGQDLIQYSINIVNSYFMDRWHLDTVLHEKMGIKTENVKKIDEPVVIYVDTDSNYVNCEPLIKSVQGIQLDSQQSVEFVLQVINLRFAKYLDNAFTYYADRYKTQNRMVFKMENISERGIFVAKKNYAYRVVYEDFFRKPKTKAKGLACTKPSHPKLAREVLWDLLEDLLDINVDIIHEKHLVPKLKKAYDRFISSPIDDICYNMYVNGLDRYALLKDEYYLVDGTDEDGNPAQNAVNKISGKVHQLDTKKKGVHNASITDEIGEYYTVKGTGSNVKGCLWFNNLIILSGNTKYVKIKSGDKIKFYYAHSKDNPKLDTFSYPPGQFSEELNYPIDHKNHFYHCIISPLNALLVAIGKQELNADMKREFKFKIPSIKDPELAYPFYAVNVETLEQYEIPKKFAKYIFTNKEIPEYLIDEYDNIISDFGNNLLVISHVDKDKYINQRQTAINKKANKELISMFDENQLRYYDTALTVLKKDFKFKVDYDNLTKETILYLTKYDRRLTIKTEIMREMKCTENYISYVTTEFQYELSEIESKKKK
jgi:hypothetical protein